MTDTKLLYNQGSREIKHGEIVIKPKATVRLDKALGDYLHKLLPEDLVDPVDVNKIFDYAETPKAAAEAPEPAAEAEEKPAEDLGSLTVAELRTLAGERGVAIPLGTNKAGIIALLAA